MPAHTSLPTLAFVGNTAWSLYNFRLGLFQTLMAKGYQVLTIAPYDDYASRLEQAGCLYEHISLDNHGTNPMRDAKSFWGFLQLYRQYRPAFIFHYTVKPNIYGTVAASFLGIPNIAVVTGLGQLFTYRSWKTRIVKLLYRWAFRGAQRVWFLNDSDADIFIQSNVVPPTKVGYLPSEGIDTDHFHQPAYGRFSGGSFKFLLAARMIAEKGVREFVEAGQLLRAKGHRVDIQLLGFLDADNPRGITRAEIDEWEADGRASYLGQTSDVRPYMERADCVVLPTYYREGVPRILMEGASMQLPLITTDHVGCRLVVKEGVNGYLCQRQSAEDLARCMEQMVQLNPSERAAFGQRGRELVYDHFREEVVIDKYLEILAQESIN